MKNTYLIHWGIKGQKWGIRRYRNPDGTLTEDGKRRYYEREESERQRLVGKQPWRELSDEELRRRTNRLNLENNYSMAKRNSVESSKSAGRKFLEGAIKTVVVAAVLELAKESIKGSIKNSVSRGRQWTDKAKSVLENADTILKSTAGLTKMKIEDAFSR